MKIKAIFFLVSLSVLAAIIFICLANSVSDDGPLADISSTALSFSVELNELLDEMEDCQKSGDIKKYNDLKARTAFYYKAIDEILNKYNDKIKQGIPITFIQSEDLKNYKVAEVKFIGCNLNPSGTDFESHFQAEYKSQDTSKLLSVQALLLDENDNAILRTYFHSLPGIDETAKNPTMYCTVNGLEAIRNLKLMILSKNYEYQDLSISNKSIRLHRN